MKTMMTALLALSTVGSLAAQAAEVSRKVPRPVQVATAVIEPVSAVKAPAAVQAVIVEIGLSGPACGRKVKVVYAGYGEANRAAC